LHKAACNSPLTKPEWLPSWELENRKPAFQSEDVPYIRFGGISIQPQYLWGNMPATDILRLELNEGVAEAKTRDFNIVFAGEETNYLASQIG